jgi:hypothetical protein
MQQRLAKENVVLIAVSVDREDEEKDVVKFLEEQHAPGPNFLINDDDGLKNDWGYENAPYLVIVGPDGKKAKSFSSDEHFTDRDVEKAVRELFAR